MDDKSWVGNWSKPSELPRKSNVRADISSGKLFSDESNTGGGEGRSDPENVPDPEADPSDGGGDIYEPERSCNLAGSMIVLGSGSDEAVESPAIAPMMASSI